VVSPAGREVQVKDPFTGDLRNMLMFASNNYLGFANHPHVINSVKKAIDTYGAGIGGPPLLNGYLKLTQETEERLAALKGQEDALLFSSGFMANLGVIGAMATHNDLIIFDELSHASFYDGLRMSHAKAISFAHNDMVDLERKLKENAAAVIGNIYLGTEGVFSMNGDLAKLDEIVALCKKYGAILILDDAHGTGVMGEQGRGTAHHFNCDKDVDVTMATFSKVFATAGGYLAANKDLIDYMRFHCRTYVFSAAIPPTITAAVLAGLDILEREPWLQQQLLDNARYAVQRLSNFEFYSTPQAAIIALKLPENMNLQKAAILLHQKNVFVNPIEYPAVAADQQRIRLSFMASHTKADIDFLATSLEEVWHDKTAYF
ncbi:MAG: aminotransferase class I/II-fold pyridoxal phosphate-dependent enzyme, partial [Saprospiraceae bacterium]